MKGLVASLISVKDTSATTALELVAGDRLYNVVVDTEVNGFYLKHILAVKTIIAASLKNHVLLEELGTLLMF